MQFTLPAYHLAEILKRRFCQEVLVWQAVGTVAIQLGKLFVTLTYHLFTGISRPVKWRVEQQY